MLFGLMVRFREILWDGYMIKYGFIFRFLLGFGLTMSIIETEAELFDFHLMSNKFIFHVLI